MFFRYFAAKLLKIIYLSILFCIQIGLHLPFLYIKEPNVGQNVALLYFKVSEKRYTFVKVKKLKKEKQFLFFFYNFFIILVLLPNPDSSNTLNSTPFNFTSLLSKSILITLI